MIGRRALVVGGVAAFAGGVATVAAAPTELTQRRLANRLELWQEYTSRSDNLLARVTTTRETSLLAEPVITTGSLLFIAPGTLVLRDDSAQGSTTIIDDFGTRVLANRSGLPSGPEIRRGTRPAADWLATRLVRIFAPVPSAQLVEGCRAVVPKGRGYRLDLLPPRGSAIRRIIRSVSMTMDPAAGAVTRIVIAQAQGDRVTLGLSDHRQGLSARDLTSITEPLSQLGITVSVAD